MIIVPIDGSSHSLKALDYAISMANHYEASLLLLNVQREKESTLSCENTDKQLETESLIKEGNDHLQEAIALVADKVPYETKVRIGVPTIEIAEEAKEKEAVSIVMGSRGNGPVISAILGSVSYGVLHLAPCPVTVVPDHTYKHV
ncbi:universal stress protein [Salipaludibacillus sp. LMS25]|jgi:nucleotide-binding universal stress UspA family protein|uniref:universal stress protein n=1 Tax=Salipaludibacillus sp. LMS25 TaxID=2924031 RepID=UPI0020D0CE31|nr:universal stress protein [Salipaludibacillus sp. LMS25]UTR15261.1 universal stress protein [Salipaludibacillus sp. LMS25]